MMHAQCVSLFRAVDANETALVCQVSGVSVAASRGRLCDHTHLEPQAVAVHVCCCGPFANLTVNYLWALSSSK